MCNPSIHAVSSFSSFSILTSQVILLPNSLFVFCTGVPPINTLNVQFFIVFVLDSFTFFSGYPVRSTNIGIRPVRNKILMLLRCSFFNSLCSAGGRLFVQTSYNKVKKSPFSINSSSIGTKNVRFAFRKRSRQWFLATL